jgi:hypothetical protein
MLQAGQQRCSLAVKGAILLASVFPLIGTEASAQMFRLNGVYIANDGTQLLVEAVPTNRGERLTLMLLNRELRVSRTDTKKPFVYSHDSCELIINPRKKANRYEISIEAFGTCRGDDQVYDGLNISYEKH